MTLKKCCFSGYRPQKFPFKLNDSDIDYGVFIKNLSITISSLIDDDCLVFYTGMAIGFDIIAAETVLKFKEKNNNIKLIAVIPFKNQENSFSEEWKKRYYDVINRCDEVITLSEVYHNGSYQNRNKFMVDSSDYVVTWYDGKQGGTRNTLSYAAKKKHYIINVNTEYLKEFNNTQIKMEI